MFALNRGRLGIQINSQVRLPIGLGMRNVFVVQRDEEDILRTP
jgi:hypothetical protein